MGVLHGIRCGRRVGPNPAWLLLAGAMAGAACAAPVPGPSGGPERSALSVGWLLRQPDLEVARVTGAMPADGRRWQTDVGGGRSPVAAPSSGRSKPLVPMLMSLALPGAGEAYLGYRRGFLMMGLDIASWYGVASNADRGRELRDEYYVFADQHWSLDRLDAAYDPNYLARIDANFDYAYWEGRGTHYYDVTPYQELPLWVSAVDDRREYYENLGKWDQFVFGWDDFTDPRDFLDVPDNDNDTRNLKDPRTSANREIYRQMRQDSNAAYTRRDRFIYLSLGLRVFSVLQVAYLEGLLFGGDGPDHRQDARALEIGGHRIDLVVEPIGLSRGVVGAAVSF